MQCTKPIIGWYGDQGPNGKRRLVFKRPPTSPNISGDLEIPCGRCIDCRLEYSRQWAIRCMHEAQLHRHNCFLTLTYDNDHLPINGTLKKDDLQKFFKRLRKHISPKKIRYYACGEYGDQNQRPHYHCLIFGYTPSDGILTQHRPTSDLYYSQQLHLIWQKGLITYGQVTFESAAYVARYATKKITGDRAQQHYERVDPGTGQVVSLLPEFACMSLKPGIGKNWYTKYQTDVYPSDDVVTRGYKSKPPRYYDLQLEKADQQLYDKVKDLRRLKASQKPKPTQQQLDAHAAITNSKLSQKGRPV